MPASPGHIFSPAEPASKRINGLFFQPKLTVNDPNDKYEQEADAVADKVMRMTDGNIAQTNFFSPSVSVLQPKCADCEEEEKKRLKRKVNSQAGIQTKTETFLIQRQEADGPTPAPANGETETSSSSSSDFLLPTPSLLQPPGSPDFLSMRQPFLNRGVPGSWNPDAALRVWNYNFNFFRGAGISPSLSTTLTNFTAPRAIDAQLRLSNPTWWEVTDREMNTSTIGGSIPLLEFNADFSPTAPSWLRSILGGGQKGVRRKCADHVNEEKMQLKEKANESTPAGDGFENYINDLDNNGQSMPTEVRNFYEPRFGYDFSNVKIHTDSVDAKSAQSINALAYTSGNNIVFNSGEYSPKTGAGKKLLAHELTHVVQQGSGNISIQRQGTPRLPPMQSFQQLWLEFEQAQWNFRTSEAVSIALRLAGMYMDLSDTGNHGLELALFLLRNGHMPEALQVLSNYESFLWIRHVSISKVPETFLESHYIDQLQKEAEQAIRSADYQNAFRLLSIVVFYAQVKLSIVSEASHGPSGELFTRMMDEIDPNLPARERRRRMADVMGTGISASSFFRLLTYGNLQSVYTLLRNSVTTFLRLQREAILSNNATLATQLATQHQNFITFLNNQHLLLSSSEAVTMQSAESLNQRGDIGYTIFGANDRTEVVTPLPGTATPTELGFFPYYHSTVERVVNDMSNQAILINDFLNIPAIRKAFPSGEINMTDLNTRIRVWQMVYSHLSSTQSSADALASVIRMIERYLRSFTIHTEYNIRDFGVSYLSTEFPTDLVGRSVRDCGVYALTTAYEVFRIARNSTPRLNLEFRLVSMPEHVTLLIINNDNNNHYLVNNDTITGPNTGDVLRSVAQAYSSTFNRGFAITPAMSTDLGSTGQTDAQFKSGAWERYQASTSWGFNAEPLTGPSDQRSLEQRTRDAYVHYYERVQEFDRDNGRLQSIMNTINARLQTTRTADRQSVLNTLVNNTALTSLVLNLANIYVHYGPMAAGAGIISVDSRTPRNVSRHILGQSASYLYALPGNVTVHPLVRYSKAVLLLENLGTAKTQQQDLIIQVINKTPDFNAEITSYTTAGFPIQFKLANGSADDPYEKQADEVADKIMRMQIIDADTTKVKGDYYKKTNQFQRKEVIPERGEVTAGHEKIRLHNTSSISAHSTSGPFIQRAPIHNSSLSQPTQRVVLPVVGSAPISDADFNLIMHHKFGVQNISTGTQQEQETSLTRHNQPPATIPNWQSWNPGSSSMIYNYIVEAFEQFGKSLGATPIVSTITFYKMNYDRDATGAVISQPTVGASFGLTDLNIFEAVTTLNSPLPYTRSITGTYRNSPVVGSTTTGSTPGAPMPVPSRSESVIRMITHELGHGAQSAAMNLPNPAQAPDPQMLNDFELAVGWTGSPMKLFDIGVPAVATALSAGTAPASQYEITPAHWNDPRWIEQPMSHYSVDGGPGEDFAEAIMVYVNDPALLQSRSPARYNFIRNRSGMWLFNMRLYNNHPSAPGDYPQRVLPEGSEYA